jgi:hypothetical protein
MALADYVGRTYDYLALRNTAATGERKIALELFDATTSGQITTGIQKLAQRWLLEFLTERGTMIGRPDRGCEFMRLARQGRFRLPIDVRAAFSAADAVIRVNLALEETDATPNDERFASAELLNVGLLPSSAVTQQSGTSAVFLTLGVRIVSLAGDTRNVVVPIEILPRD